MSKEKIYLFDTTLRDGAQTEGVDFGMDDKVKIAKINIDSNPDIPTKYNIMSIPTLLLFKNGELISNQVGLQEKSTLSNWIKENL